MTGNERKRDILLFVNRFSDLNGYSPSYREIAEAVGLKAVSTVAHYVKMLEREGQLVHRPGGTCRAVGAARNISIRMPEGMKECTRRIAVRVADGGVLEMDMSVSRPEPGQTSVTFGGILDATQLRKPVGRVISCSVEAEEMEE